jgi:hypothetical protein
VERPDSLTRGGSISFRRCDPCERTDSGVRFVGVVWCAVSAANPRVIGRGRCSSRIQRCHAFSCAEMLPLAVQEQRVIEWSSRLSEPSPAALGIGVLAAGVRDRSLRHSFGSPDL